LALAAQLHSGLVAGSGIGGRPALASGLLDFVFTNELIFCLRLSLPAPQFVHHLPLQATYAVELLGAAAGRAPFSPQHTPANTMLQIRGF